MQPTLAADSAWTLPQKILFRFLFVYFILFCFPFPLDAFEFTWPITKPYHDLRIWSISQIGNLFFNIEAESLLSYRQGRDDSFNFILRFVSLFIAALASLIWSFSDRHRANYERLDQWFRLYLRYYLVFMMLGYGFNKVFLIQGTPFSASKLGLNLIPAVWLIHCPIPVICFYRAFGKTIQ